MLRLYHVFNVAQCENLKNVPPIVAPVTAEATTATNADAEAIVAAMPNARKSNTAWPRILRFRPRLRRDAESRTV